MPDQPDRDLAAEERLTAARRDYRALSYDVALLTADRTLELDVYRQLKGDNQGILDLFSRSARLLVENLSDVARASATDLMRARIARLRARFGDLLDPGEPPPLPAAEMDRTVHRLLGDDAGGAP